LNRLIMCRTRRGTKAGQSRRTHYSRRAANNSAAVSENSASTRGRQDGGYYVMEKGFGGRGAWHRGFYTHLGQLVAWLKWSIDRLINTTVKQTIVPEHHRLSTSSMLQLRLISYTSSNRNY